MANRDLSSRRSPSLREHSAAEHTVPAGLHLAADEPGEPSSQLSVLDAIDLGHWNIGVTDAQHRVIKQEQAILVAGHKVRRPEGSTLSVAGGEKGVPADTAADMGAEVPDLRAEIYAQIYSFCEPVAFSNYFNFLTRAGKPHRLIFPPEAIIASLWSKFSEQELAKAGVLEHLGERPVEREDSTFDLWNTTRCFDDPGRMFFIDFDEKQN